jgi:glycosyltransferase involved in cell wall biosynthesis
LSKSKKIDVVFVFPTFAGGGAQRVAITLAGSLDRDFFRPMLIVFDDLGPLKSTVPANLPIHVIGKARLRNAYPKLIRMLRSIKPEIVYSTLGYVNLSLIAGRIMLPKKTKLIVREANMPSISLHATSYPKLSYVLYRLLYQKAHKVIATSQRMSSELIGDFKVSTKKISILPNPVDIQKTRGQVKQVRSFQNKGRNFILAGRLVPQKGYDRLIDIIPQLDEDSHFTILGEGPLKEKLVTQSENLGIADRITWAGFQKNPWEWFAGADAFIMPSRWEGMPNAALEALTCGLPVIATSESGGFPELVKHVRPGAICIADFESDFVAALQLAPKKSGFGQNPSLLPSNHQVQHVVEEFSKILTSLIKSESIQGTE